ncbi:MAG: TlpA family protein disulfide reductase [Pseudomonas sp.]|nr:TlpA family protein disulfide reductase [Pseudomonas sp.]
MTDTSAAHTRLLLSASLAVLLAACKPAADAPAPAAAPEPAPAPATAAPDAPADANADAAGGAAASTAAAAAGPRELKLTAIDGSTYDLAAQRGQWVVVNFWATWCAPCLKEMPELSALDAMREDVSVVGLAYEEIDVPAMQAFLAKRPVVYPIAIVDTYDPPAAFDTPRGLPMTYLLKPDGTVAEQFLGPVTAESLQEAIAKAGGPAAKAPAKG